MYQGTTSAISRDTEASTISRLTLMNAVIPSSTSMAGAFTLGGPEDDARWATAVVSNTRAVVCSVHYRRAPEHPFPPAVGDGVDAVFYLIDYAEELGTGPLRIAVSGFSADGNMSFTVPCGWKRSSASERSAGAGLRAIWPQRRVLPSSNRWPFSMRRNPSRS